MTSRYIIRTDNMIIDTKDKEVVVINKIIYIKEQNSGEWQKAGESKLQLNTTEEIIKYHNRMVEKGNLTRMAKGEQ